ncbi:MAG: metallophosphoesterase family protein, partial [Fulvivirga sp.]
MKIGLISDTHGHLDAKVFEYFAACDEIWHAGDIGTLEVLEKLEKFKPTRAVFGNIDGHTIRAATVDRKST